MKAVIDFRAQLNPVQLEAVTHGTGPLLIVAGAGSGKTRILTCRVAHLISQGVQPSAILGVTFTNKAADEMARRVEKLVSASVPLSTFHSFCLRVLRAESDHIPYQRNFVVYDKTDQLTLVKDCMRRLNISEKHAKPRAFSNAISRAKDRLITAPQFAKSVKSYMDESVANVYSEYETAILKANAMDFDDLIMRCVELFQKQHDILAKYQQRFSYMLVDEFQDTNHAQYVLTKLLAQKHRNICVVGDPDQSIYRFRGAEIRNILDFERDFKDARVILLEQNYRSTATILEAANHVVSHNVERKEKKLWTKNDAGAPVSIFRAADENDEARFVARCIRELSDEQAIASLNDVVIFYRIHALSRVFEEEFRRARLPHAIIGDVGFYSRREIKDIVAYLRVVVNPADDVNVRRIVNVPHRGLGESSQEVLARYARACSISFYDALDQAAKVPRLAAGMKRKIGQFMTLLKKLQKAAQSMLPTEFIRLVLDETHYIEEMCGSGDTQDRARVENIKELISAAAEYENTCPDERASIDGFLHEIALSSELDSWNDSAESVTLMTVHNAKGLEFPVVFMVGLEEDLFPHFNSLEDPTDVEEERRLCYVGMTRAQKRLTMTSAYHRTVFGQRKVREPSRFLTELPSTHSEVRISDHRDSITDAPPPEQPRRGSATHVPDNGEYQAGLRVKHPHFGPGVIESVQGSGDEARLTIKFESLPGPKVLVAKYAKLRAAR